ncbi:hypothetical protein LZ017_19000 [Pelomonas sp. CA6]|uniref:hypothetical protein n=1 Tax=Pelomonas sp. CA6 TaxID=2907999 RepID=UPI001F4C1365|nr:hypothetical protein [Pelomonas sp. CA6]MCH7345470.1 hypothetical protein [Pelomonas sp. CA6]
MQALFSELPRRATLGLAGMAGLGLALPLRAAAQPPVQALLPDDVLEDYRRFLAGRAPLTLRDYGGAHSRRDVAEVLLLQQALQAGGDTRRVSLGGMPTDARLQLELRSGRALCSATSYWRADVSEVQHELLLSAAVLQQGEFEAGLYTLPGHARALGCRTLAEVRRLTVLSNRDWHVDWQTLRALGLQHLLHVGNWKQMPRMLASGRADVLLAPFQPTPDLSLQVDGLRLVPIPGLKIEMHGTRHFLISRSHPQGQVLRERLDAGLAELRRQGLLRRAYQQSGFFNSRVQDWTVLRAG